MAISPNLTERTVIWTFIILHIFLYPASNGFNSYFDKDEQSIGGLKTPPPVTQGLYYLALLFDLVAIVLGFLLINVTFAVMLFIYGMVSKAYSHPAVRLKKYPVWGWLVAGVFQGFFTFAMAYIGVNDYGLENIWKASVIIPAFLSTVMLWANYPMTQVYQHDEDGKRGDETISRRLGIRGTFYFVASIFSLVTAGFLWYFFNFFSIRYGISFLIALSPVIIYFGYWFIRVYQNPSAADYTHTMWLNFISATSLNIFFIYLFLYSTNYIQLLT